VFLKTRGEVQLALSGATAYGLWRHVQKPAVKNQAPVYQTAYAGLGLLSSYYAYNQIKHTASYAALANRALRLKTSSNQTANDIYDYYARLVYPLSLMSKIGFSYFAVTSFFGKPDKLISSGALEKIGIELVARSFMVIFSNALENYSLMSSDSIRPATDLPQGFHEVGGTIPAELTKTAAYLKAGLMPQDGLILFGEPGTGKTLLVKALAGETKVPLFCTSVSDLKRDGIAKQENNLSLLFMTAALTGKTSPSGKAILFIDELETLGGRRDAPLQDPTARSLTGMLLMCISNPLFKNVLVVGCTNYFHLLDSALTRNGRLGKWIKIEKPTAKESHDIFMKLLNNARNNQQALMEKKIISARIDFATLTDDEITAIMRLLQGQTPAFMVTVIHEVCSQACILRVPVAKDLIEKTINSMVAMQDQGAQEVVNRLRAATK